MALREATEAQGNWLFRHRGTLPLLLLPLLLIAVRAVERDESVNMQQLEKWYQVAGLTIAFAGWILRGYTVGTVPRGTSGRNTATQEALVLNTSGMYSVVRHPLYVGNYFVMIGCTVFTGSWWLPLLVSVMFWAYYDRIAFAEEEYLRLQFGDEFSGWAKRTPAFFPRVRQWESPSLPFSWRTALRREYGAMLTILSFCAGSELIGDLVFDPSPRFETFWAVVLTVGIAQALVLRWLKRKTVLLNVRGRP
jgi:protein-S-isoprenylcysteine O-methyltransferase Ste14